MGRPDSPVAQGNIETVVWTLGVVGFGWDIISGILVNAANLAEEEPMHMLGRYLPAERSTKRSKSNVSE